MGVTFYSAQLTAHNNGFFSKVAFKLTQWLLCQPQLAVTSLGLSSSSVIITLTLKVASNFLSPALNFSRIGVRLVVIWSPPKIWGSLFSSFGGLRGVLEGLGGLCFQDTRQMEAVVFSILQIFFHSTSQFEDWRISVSSSSFSWGLFSRMFPLDHCGHFSWIIIKVFIHFRWCYFYNNSKPWFLFTSLK